MSIYDTVRCFHETSMQATTTFMHFHGSQHDFRGSKEDLPRASMEVMEAKSNFHRSCQVCREVSETPCVGCDK